MESVLALVLVEQPMGPPWEPLVSHSAGDLACYTLGQGSPGWLGDWQGTGDMKQSLPEVVVGTPNEASPRIHSPPGCPGDHLDSLGDHLALGRDNPLGSHMDHPGPGWVAPQGNAHRPVGHCGYDTGVPPGHYFAVAVAGGRPWAEPLDCCSGLKMGALAAVEGVPVVEDLPWVGPAAAGDDWVPDEDFA